MTAAREDILARIRRANGRNLPGGGDVDAVLRHRMEAPPAHPIPARTRGDAAALIESFIRRAGEASATLDRVASRGDTCESVLRYLLAEGLPARIRIAPDPVIAGLPWSDTPDLVVEPGRAVADDMVSVTPALAGIAETGTLLVHSSAATPNTLHFLPDTHIAVLDSGHIVGGYEQGWALLRDRCPEMPRSVTLITGPSRSSDIERELQIGVHGPRRLHIILVDGETT